MRIINYFKNKILLKLINRVLFIHKEFKVKKIKDFSNSGLFWFNILLENKNSDALNRGSGADFSESMAIIKAWAEFVERDSLKNYAKKININLTSNGFAAHSEIELCKDAALAELVERDSLLTSWLLLKPAIATDIQQFIKSDTYYEKKLSQLSLYSKILFGELPSCMGFRVFICFVKSNYFGIATAAHRNGY